MDRHLASLRFHAELNDFLPSYQAKKDLSVEWGGRRTVKDLIESLGVPQAEIGIITIRGTTVPLTWIVCDQDPIDVYPRLRFFDQTPRFIVDDNVARLTGLLRLFGFDTLSAAGASDAAIASLSWQEQRFVLTRDVGLLKRKRVTEGLYIRSVRPHDQVREVLQRLRLQGHCRPFTRCLVCNGLLGMMAAEEADASDRIPPDVRLWAREFFRCSGCGRVFWQGSHHEKMERLVREILDQETKHEAL